MSTTLSVDPARCLVLVRRLDGIAQDLHDHADRVVRGAAAARWYGRGASAFHARAHALAAEMHQRATDVELVAGDLRRLILRDTAAHHG